MKLRRVNTRKSVHGCTRKELNAACKEFARCERLKGKSDSWLIIQNLLTGIGLDREAPPSEYEEKRAWMHAKGAERGL